MVTEEARKTEERKAGAAHSKSHHSILVGRQTIKQYIGKYFLIFWFLVDNIKCWCLCRCMGAVFAT